MANIHIKRIIFICRISPSGEYIPRGRTVLHTILNKHFNDFVDNYELKYVEVCGRYSLERIISLVEEYLKCGSAMQIVSFIMDPEQIDRIMQHLINKGRAPPGMAVLSTI